MYKFAVLPYINAVPLIHFIPRFCQDAKLIYRTPSNTVSELVNGTVDAAIIPVADFFNTPGLEIVKGLGICANGNVESVLLQCKIQLKNTRCIRLDKASKTSNLLLKILIKNHFLTNHVIHFDKDIQNADAEVIIGDRALSAKPAFESYDLAGEWKAMTGLPLVFAVWAYRTRHPDSKRLTKILYAAKQAGCNAKAAISEIYSKKLRISTERCYNYLTNRIHYNISHDEDVGMRLFHQLSMDFINYSERKIRTTNIQSKDTIDVNKQHQFA